MAHWLDNLTTFSISFIHVPHCKSPIPYIHGQPLWFIVYCFHWICTKSTKSNIWEMFEWPAIYHRQPAKLYLSSHEITTTINMNEVSSNMWTWSNINSTHRFRICHTKKTNPFVFVGIEQNAICISKSENQPWNDLITSGSILMGASNLWHKLLFISSFRTITLIISQPHSYQL